ncbi:hypothetical protein GRW71_22480, partial [Escherichia coli]|nr:hypothetical protein [Escherichia coli]MWJ73232.1 hypothetical protein [Escherichia coli]MWJ77683.1 hypothetical protein [Escherichia coli]MWK43489.1 hypothetical protein [Escherichia coli]MWK54218.1 hypothetical protein [Escherichia coli]
MADFTGELHRLISEYLQCKRRKDQSVEPTPLYYLWSREAVANDTTLNRPGFPGECFICELRLPDHRFRWKHNKLFLLLPEEYGPAFPA